MHHEEQFCEIILNLGRWFRRKCRLKDFLSRALAVLTIYAILKAGIMANIHGIWTSVQKEMSFKHISYLELYQTICAMLEEGMMRNNFVKLF